jgi:hypothetical protein
MCVYSLPSILVWQTARFYPQAAVVDDMAVIALEYNPPKQHHRHMLLPVAGQRMVPPETLHDLAADFGFDKFRSVPEPYIEAFGKERIDRRFHIREQPDFTDYIYRQEDLAELRGNRYAKKRNLIRQFHRSHVSGNRVCVSAMGPADIPECLRFLDRWYENRRQGADSPGGLSSERMAAKNALDHIHILPLRGLCLRIDGKLSAFGIAAAVTETMGTLLFQKADSTVKGLYQYFDQACAKRLFADFTEINKESDLGVPGIARSKRSYHPARYIRSYELVLR